MGIYVFSVEKCVLVLLCLYYEDLFRFSDPDANSHIEEIFGLNKINIIIDAIICLFIMISYIYFGENNIIEFPKEMTDKVYAYCLGVIPIIFGSHIGAIFTRIIVESKIS
jgi:hypothetical protein